MASTTLNQIGQDKVGGSRPILRLHVHRGSLWERGLENGEQFQQGAGWIGGAHGAVGSAEAYQLTKSIGH
jgi:hypothetical protein